MMANILYNQKSVSVNNASVRNQYQQPYSYIGFNSNSKKSKFKLYDIDLVKQDLINMFYIRKGEKLQNPAFGTVIWDMLFENFTEEVKTIIANDVQTIVNYDPRLTVNSVTVTNETDSIKISLDLIYLPFNVNEKMTLTFDQNNKIG
jgi:phage baseplate assembly protein W